MGVKLMYAAPAKRRARRLGQSGNVLVDSLVWNVASQVTDSGSLFNDPLYALNNALPDWDPFKVKASEAQSPKDPTKDASGNAKQPPDLAQWGILIALGAGAIAIVSN